MIDIIALVISMALWVAVGYQLSNGDHWLVITFFTFLAIANAVVALKDVQVLP